LFALLAWTVAHGQGPYAFERPIFGWLQAPSSTRAWNDVAEALGLPAIVAVVVISIAFGIVKRTYVRVVAYAAIAATAFLLSDYVAKLLVQRYYYGELSFPSGNVTAVSAIALAMWLALYPLFGNRLRAAVLILGTAWIGLMAVAVVGALWHTPIDDLGSVLLSGGIVCGGAVVYERAASRVAPSSRRQLATPASSSRRY